MKGIRRRNAKRNPSKRKTRKRVSNALKKWMKAGGLAKKNPGRKVKGGRAVSLRNFSGTITKKRNGQVVIKGRSR